jgi:hypothetical protein
MVVGVIAETVSDPPVALVGGKQFSPDTGAHVGRIKNWPADTAAEAEGLSEGLLLLGGERADGSWWYELAGFAGPNEHGCWPIYGGSFDRGEAVQLSSGLWLTKAPGFEIRDSAHEDMQWFPGHSDDYICVDEQGRAVYFGPFRGA